MRIASVSIEYPSPGNPRRGLFIQRRLASLACLADVHVVNLQPWFPWLRPMPPRVALYNGPEAPPAVRPAMLYLPGVLKRLDSHWVRRAVVPAVRALEADRPFDLIDAHFGYPEGVGCVRAALEIGRPVFMTLRSLESQVLVDRHRGPQLRWAFEHCTGVVCVSESLRQLALQHGLAAEKVRVIPNTVERECFHPGGQAEARRLLNLPANGRLIVCVGMLVHGKGQHLLIQALRQLQSAHPDLRLALVGSAAHEPRYPELLRKLIADLGLTDAVLLPGSQSPQQVAAWLRAADIFALPTFDEGCCNAVLEAMACGLPVVSTPAGDNAVLIDPPRRGLLVPMDDAAALADGIAQALATTWDRGQIARHGADYTWKEVARQTEQFFRDRLKAAKGEKTCAA